MNRLPNVPGTRMPRPRVVGQRLASLEHVLQDPETNWQTLTIDWYRQGK